jgi:hypothetical protein
MNAYEAKQEARKQRMLDLADRMQAASDAAYKHATAMASVIPMGQPILVGHHSEKGDRAYRARIWRTQDRCLELQRKAEYFRGKAAGVGKGGISSDDPEAVVKLREELAKLEAMQARMKAINTAHKQFLKDAASLDKSTLSDKDKEKIRHYKPAYSWEPHPYPPYSMSNNNANMSRIKKRIATLGMVAASSDQDDKEHDCGAYRVVECFADNRVRVFFPGKPSDVVRSVLKRNGFRWSPDAGAWQRMLNGGIVEWLTRTDEGGYLRRQIEGAA